MRPDLIIIGQVTVDDVVPATPGAWGRQIGGSSLYALAGARLWLDPGRIGLLARIGKDYPFDVEGLLRSVGLKHIALPRLAGEHLVEWLIYEPNGSRRSLPRNLELLEVGAEGDVGPAGAAADATASPNAAAAAEFHPYRQKLLDIAPAADEIPAAWLPAPAVHLCPQVGDRHRDALRTLRKSVRWISVDPSPHYSRSLDAAALARFLEGTTALLPSANEVQPLLRQAAAESVALQLHREGIPEVVIKRGADPIVLADQGASHCVPVIPAQVVDPTGAGDSFCGAYAACRLLGHPPLEAARRAAASAALVVGCSGVEAALQLATPKA